MGFVITAKEYELMTEGIHNVTITEVQDLGPQDSAWGVQDRMRVIFTADDQKGKKGDPVQTALTLTKSIGPKSSFFKLLTQLGLGTPGMKNFDPDTLIGIKVQVVIEHKESKDGRIFANIATVLKRGRSVTVVQEV